MTIAHKIITVTFHALYDDINHPDDALEKAFECGLLDAVVDIPGVIIGEIESQSTLQEFPHIVGFEDLQKIGSMTGRAT